MRVIYAAFFIACAAAARAEAPAIADLSSASDVAAAVREAPEARDDLLSAAIGLGVAAPVDLVFALISPETPAEEVEALAAALVRAAPDLMDETAAATVLAAGIEDDEARVTALIAVMRDALFGVITDPALREKELIETVAALLAVTAPGMAFAIAEAAAPDGNGAALLAALGEGPETAAIDAPAPRFSRPEIINVLTPGGAAQDAPSAN